jgi:tape measure domain-containing protein
MAQEAQIKITADTSQAERALGNLTGQLQKMATVIASSFAVSEFVKFADEMIRLDNRLQATTKSTEGAAKSMENFGYASEAVRRIAQDTRTPLTDVADIYGRLSLSLTQVGYSQATVAETSKTFIQAVKLSGATAMEQQSAILQFGQALTKGVLKWDDLKPLMTAAPGYVLELQKALGMTNAEFMVAAHTGKLTTDKLIEATRTMADSVQKDFDRMKVPFSESMTVLQNSIAMAVGKIDDFLGISQAFAAVVKFMADHTGVLIGVMVGLTAAVAALLIPLIPAATAMTILTGGAVLLGAAGAGAALGYMAEKMGLLGDNAKKTADEQKKINDLMKAGENVDKNRRTTDQLMAATKIGLELDKMKELAKAEAERYQVGVLQYEIKKQTAIEEEKMVAVGGHLNSLEKQKIASAVTAKILATEKFQVDKQIGDLKSQYITLGIVDIDQQQIATQMETFRLSVSKETYAMRKNELQAQLELNQAKSIQATYDRIGAPPAKSEIATGAANMFGNTAEGILDNAKKQQIYLDALKERGKISTQSYADQEVLINKAKTDAILAQEQSVADARMRINGVTNQAIIDAVKDQMKNVAMIQQGGVTGFQGVLGALDNVMSSMSAQNRKAFEAHKALATAQAIISTYQAAAEAIAFPPGPPLSFIYVAGAIAAGMAQVAAIQSQSYSGKALGGSVMSNTPYIVGEKGPELFTPAGSGTITPNSELRGGAKDVTINFNIQANDAVGFDELLVQRRSMVTQMVRDAMNENGQRSRM